jgi:hypothetical protein
VVVEPRDQGAVTFAFVPGEGGVDRRQRADTHIGRAQHGPAVAVAVGGDRQVARLRRGGVVEFEVGERGCGGPLGPVYDEGPLVASRVNHCDLRDLEWSAVVGPSEWRGATVVVLDEGDDPVGQIVDGVEFSVLEQAALKDREEQLDLVEP